MTLRCENVVRVRCVELLNNGDIRAEYDGDTILIHRRDLFQPNSPNCNMWCIHVCSSNVEVPCLVMQRDGETIYSPRGYAQALLERLKEEEDERVSGIVCGFDASNSLIAHVDLGAGLTVSVHASKYTRNRIRCIRDVLPLGTRLDNLELDLSNEYVRWAAVSMPTPLEECRALDVEAGKVYKVTASYWHKDTLYVAFSDYLLGYIPNADSTLNVGETLEVYVDRVLEKEPNVNIRCRYASNAAACLQERIMPDLTGQAYTEARRQFSNNPITVVRSKAYPDDIIYRTDPAAGETMDGFSALTFYVGCREDPNSIVIQMPDMTGLHESKAIDELSKLGITHFDRIHMPSQNVEKDQVIQTFPPANENPLSIDTDKPTVKLIISSGRVEEQGTPFTNDAEVKHIKAEGKPRTTNALSEAIQTSRYSKELTALLRILGFLRYGSESEIKSLAERLLGQSLTQAFVSDLLRLLHSKYNAAAIWMFNEEVLYTPSLLSRVYLYEEYGYLSKLYDFSSYASHQLIATVASSNLVFLSLVDKGLVDFEKAFIASKGSKDLLGIDENECCVNRYAPEDELIIQGVRKNANNEPGWLQRKLEQIDRYYQRLGKRGRIILVFEDSLHLLENEDLIGSNTNLDVFYTYDALHRYRYVESDLPLFYQH